MTTEKVIAAPLKCWIANANAADPGRDAAPDTSIWNLFADTKDIIEGGVKFTLDQQMMEHRTDGVLAIKKAFRTSVDLMVNLEIDQTGCEQLAILLDNLLLTTSYTSTSHGMQKVSFYRGVDVITHALLLEGPSTKLAGAIMRIYIPQGYFYDKQEINYTKSKVAFYSLNFKAMASGAMPEYDQIGYMYEVNANPA